MGRQKKMAVVSTEKVWLNEKEAAAYLGVGSKDTFLELRNSGKLPFSTPIGKRIVYSIWDLDKLVLENSVGPVTYQKNQAPAGASRKPY